MTTETVQCRGSIFLEVDCSVFGHFTAWCMQLLYSDCCSVCDVIMHGSCSRGHVFDRLPRVVLLDSPFYC